MASDYTRQWIEFFRGCGIPGDIAARYGLIFNENRIRKNMLLDLNKEYLRDMGITVMGDIIAILRHAKIVHDKYMREQILFESEENSPLQNVGINDNQTTKKSSTMKRILEHYTRKSDSSQFHIPHETVQICIENENSPANTPKKLANRIGLKSKAAVKQKIEAPSTRSDDLVPGKLEVPVPKLRRVLPENEGNYTIKMPSGTTERSKKLLEKAKLKQNKTVFDRLGESSVSSTSDITTTSGTTTHIAKVPNNKEKNILSVFSRLGEKSPLVTSTSSNGNSSDLPDQLPYKGILKTKAVKKKIQLSPSSTMRADNELHISNTNNTKFKRGNLVKERLGTSPKTNQSSQLDSSLKPNRLQMAKTLEENSLQGQPLFKQKLKAIASESIKEKKKILDGLSSLRSETLQNKFSVTSTTQLSDGQRGVKRRLQDTETANNHIPDVSQSKKVRFGRTTQRLIPGNNTSPKLVRSDFYGQITLTESYDGLANKNFTLNSGVRIGPMNSDKIRQKLSLKERIGMGSMSKSGQPATELKKKRSLKFNNRLKKRTISIHDRLG